MKPGAVKDFNMSEELARIQPVQKMACPDCRQVLPEWSVEEFENRPRCPHCGRRVQLPEATMEKLRASRYLGKNLDFMA